MINLYSTRVPRSFSGDIFDECHSFKHMVLEQVNNCMQKNKVAPLCHTINKIKSKIIKDTNVRDTNYKTLRSKQG